MDINDLIEERILPQLKQPIWDNWYVKEKIGIGSFSAVYRAEAKRTRITDEAALKIEAIIADRPFISAESKESFLKKQRDMADNETIIMKKLRDCPNIVRYEEEKIEPFYVGNRFEGYYSLIRMELLTSVDTLMYRNLFDYSERNVRRLAAEIGQGLQFAHAHGIIHRDIKPENMFISRTGIYKLGDFHIAKKAVTARSFAGTNYYMAPEIFYVRSETDGTYTQQADIYSLGICLYQMMNNGLFPFEGDEFSIDEAMDKRLRGEDFPPPRNASSAFGKVILKACAFDVHQRYHSMNEFLIDLKYSTASSARHNQNASAPEHTDAYPSAVKEKNSIMPYLITACLIAMIIVGVMAFPKLLNDNNDDADIWMKMHFTESSLHLHSFDV